MGRLWLRRGKEIDMRAARKCGPDAISPEEEAGAQGKRQGSEQPRKRQEPGLRNTCAGRADRIGGQKRTRSRYRCGPRRRARRRLLRLLWRPRSRRLNCARRRPLPKLGCSGLGVTRWTSRGRFNARRRPGLIPLICRRGRPWAFLVARPGDISGKAEVLKFPRPNRTGRLRAALRRRVLRGRGCGRERKPGRQSSNRQAPGAPHVLPAPV